MLRRVVNACLFLCLSVSLQAQENASKKAADYVNPLIGTQGMGHTFPGACVPFGIVQLSPDTDTIPHNVNGAYQKEAYVYCAGYQYQDPTIVGFSHTHLSGTGHSDLGDILLMPAVGEVQLNPGRATVPEEGYRSRFNHDSEKARAGYYEVMLEDYAIKAQLTATQRVGVHQYTFPKERGNGHLVIDLTHGIYNYEGKTRLAFLRVENDTLLTGYRITEGWARTNYTYFAISFSQPIQSYGFKDKQQSTYKGFWRRFNQYENFPEMAGREVVSYFHFNTTENPTLLVKVALSGVSTEGALKNLKAEAEGKTFKALTQEASAQWNKALSKLQIEGTDDDKAMLYTSFYHTLINPSVYMDVDGKYRGLDHNIHQADGFTNYTIFSLWDTYRAEHPFLNLFFPAQDRDMVKSMIAHQQQSVHHMLPVWSLMGNENWCMSGYHAVPVLADAICKENYADHGEALKAMVETSNVGYYDFLADYIKQGYVPFEKSSTSASTTLEYAYDDWCIYNTALKEGNQEVASCYRQRALNYRNLFHPTLKFIAPRYADGTFKPDFDPLQTHGEGFIEGNSWNFSFHAPHDVFGLMKAMGGEKVFIKRLNQLFEMELPKHYYEKNEDITEEGLIGGYVHGNEPSHHIPYLYAWTSQPWHTQYWVRHIVNRMYRNHIAGLGGNDDCGQMSAWYLFTVMGFYPVCPGTDQYVLGAPRFTYLKATLPNGKSLEIKAPNVSDKHCYVRSLRINGQVVNRLYVTHQEVLNGGLWEYEMSDKPATQRGRKSNDKPYSLTQN